MFRRILPLALAPVLGAFWATGPGGVPAAQTTVAQVVGAPFDPAPLAGRCGDPAGSWLGMRWFTEYRWLFNGESVPSYLQKSAARPWAATALTATRAAARTVATGRNDCGLEDLALLRQAYDGGTGRSAAITDQGGCGGRDGHNVVSFGSLPAGLLAVTCVWWEGVHQDQHGVHRDQHSVEADILVNSAGGVFFLTQPDDCRTRWDLESILTHEFGHVFGLGHVSYARHSVLTMSDGLPECVTGYRSLGLGDYLTLRRHYTDS
ncbi:MAG: hypothetical protein HKP61_12015 [Dactylosporangium sp.]|nr:hypothetical protein [Dactylosporangium sp.]NNJ61649.1 hypothetical protein [Dactylosporangium sp.]